MKHLFITLLLVLLLLAAIEWSPKSGHVYDCRISEISPDIPPAVREECRKLNSEARKK